MNSLPILPSIRYAEEMTSLLVLANCPNTACAEGIAQTVLQARLAACVNILAPCRSVYRWQDTLETAEEVPLLIKTTSDAYPALEATIKACHPYSLPEIIALPITHGLPAYLNWLASETVPPTA